MANSSSWPEDKSPLPPTPIERHYAEAVRKANGSGTEMVQAKGSSVQDGGVTLGADVWVGQGPGLGGL
jgi:hypothetical protein